MKYSLLLAFGALALSANAEYVLIPNNGNLPEDVTAENISGVLPDASVYKNGFTDQGWTVGPYGDVSSALIAPSYMPSDQTCMSALVLPVIPILPGEFLQCQDCAVFPRRQEIYTVEIRRESESDWTLLKEVSRSGSGWNAMLLDLATYAGSQCQIRFVCRSQSGYMLALDQIRVTAPDDCSFVCSREAPRFFSLADCEGGAAPVSFSLRNVGNPLTDVSVGISVDGISVAETYCPGIWNTDESESISLFLPISLNTVTDYSVYVRPQSGQPVSLLQDFAYMTSLPRRLLVDKGTGMWCPNCPTAIVDINKLEEQYGDNLIVVDTHYDDLYANDIYYAGLSFYSLPRMKLNRIRATDNATSARFKNYLCMPTEIGIDIENLSLTDSNTLSVKASVATSADFSSSATYRIGYVLTKTITAEIDPRIYQQNSCSLPDKLQFYYLPSKIPAPLCQLPDTSLPSPLATKADDQAFVGMEGSLPLTLYPSESYSSQWEIPLPVGYDNFSDMRLVAYVIDTETKTVINSVAVDIDALADVAPVIAPAAHTDAIFSIDGRCVGSSLEGLPHGIYILNGKKIKI